MADGELEHLPLEACLQLLRSQSVGRLAVVIDGFPIILPLNYRLVEAGVTWLAIRTRPGNVIDTAPMQVAFEIDGIDPIHRQGWSVLVRGMLQHADATADFRERFDPTPWLADERDAWLMIEPFAITGRRLHASEQEWAFLARAYL